MPRKCLFKTSIAFYETSDIYTLDISFCYIHNYITNIIYYSIKNCFHAMFNTLNICFEEFKHG